MTDLSLVEKVRALPAGVARHELDEAERKYIAEKIKPWIERQYGNVKLWDRVTGFEIHGEGLNKTIEWVIVGHGDQCGGCYGRGHIRSHKGTETECPDCDGGGYEEGTPRTIVTDYDGDEIQVAA